MATHEIECPQCRGTGRVVVLIGSALRAPWLAVLEARYDPATGAIIRRWTDVAALCGISVEQARMHDARATASLRRWQSAAEAGLPLVEAAADALSKWRAVLIAGAHDGRYHAPKPR